MFKRKMLNYNKKSVMFSWFYSYITILFISITIGAIVYTQANVVITQLTSKANAAFLTQIQIMVDKQMQAVESLSQQISLNPRVNNIMYSNEPESISNTYIMQEALKDFKAFGASNKSINNFYVYFKNTSRVLTQNGSSNRKLIYETLHKVSGFPYEQWVQLAEMKHNKNIFSLSTIKEDGSISKNIVFVQSLPLDLPEKALASVFVFLDETAMTQIVNNNEWIAKGNFYIIDKNDNILYAAKPNELYEFTKYSDIKKEQQFFREPGYGKQMVISYKLSEFSNWKYVSIIPANIFAEKTKYLQKITIVVLVFYLLVGGIAVWLFTKRNYLPIRKLLQSISMRADMSNEQKINEYDFIQEIVSKTFEEKDIINQKLDQQNQVLKNNFFTRILKGKLQDKIPIDDLLSSYKIKFNTPYFMVLLFYVEEFGDLYDGKEEFQDNNLKLVQFAIGNVIEELVNKKHSSYVIELDDMLVCLVNLESSQDDKEKNIQEVFDITSKAQQFLNENFGISFSVSISNVHKEIQGIAAGYYQALENLEYRMVMGSGIIIRCSDIQVSENNYSYSIEKEIQLINCVKTGDYKTAQGIVDEIFDNSFGKGLLPMQTTKCLMFDLVNTMIKTINEISIVCDSSFIEQLGPVNLLLECETIQEMRQQIDGMLKKVCEYVERVKKNNNNDDLKSAIVEYVNQNYFDLNLSIATIAPHFDMSPVSLSRFFKDQFSEGLLDYINNVRIAKAKVLLKDENKSIIETAAAVGYCNSNTFIRAFKKCEGITPGRYKELG